MPTASHESGRKVDEPALMGPGDKNLRECNRSEQKPRRGVGLLKQVTRMRQCRAAWAWLFRRLQDIGINVLPAHFYWPIPSMKSLGRKNWSECSVSEALDLRLAEQTRRLEADLMRFAAEWDFPERPVQCEYEFNFNNGFFERVDAEIAYSMVRHHKPRAILEVGSGNTTKLLAAALRKNEEEGFHGDLISIDPHPESVLLKGFPGLTGLIPEPVERLSVYMFRTLGPGDILFLDSSHVVAVGNDVVYEYLRILPQLHAGVIVHIHDIFTPLDYPKKFVMDNLCFWSEQYLLEAFLSYNRAFRVLWASSAMQWFHSEMLAHHFPAWVGSYTRMPSALKTFSPTIEGANVRPCSFWMEKVAA
jgi:hypothetical protein